MMVEKLLKLPGFLYDIGGRYYYLGKWICKECTDTEATDCVTMYHMCRNGHEEPDTNLYFQKIRAFSDFTLDIPYNPAQIAGFVEDMEKYSACQKGCRGISFPCILYFFEKICFINTYTTIPKAIR